MTLFNIICYTALLAIIFLLLLGIYQIKKTSNIFLSNIFKELFEYRKIVDKNTVNLKIRLDEEEFKYLVQGGSVVYISDYHATKVSIYLADIGLCFMETEIAHAAVDHPYEGKILERKI